MQVQLVFVGLPGLQTARSNWLTSAEALELADRTFPGDAYVGDGKAVGRIEPAPIDTSTLSVERVVSGAEMSIARASILRRVARKPPLQRRG